MIKGKETEGKQRRSEQEEGNVKGKKDKGRDIWKRKKKKKVTLCSTVGTFISSHQSKHKVRPQPGFSEFVRYSSEKRNPHAAQKVTRQKVQKNPNTKYYEHTKETRTPFM